MGSCQSWHHSHTFPFGDQFSSYQATLVDGGYATRAIFTRQGGCPYGPGTYSTSSGDPIRAGIDGSGGTVRTCYGLNGLLQTGYGKPRAGLSYTPIGTSWAYYGPQRTRMKRIKHHSEKVGVVFCGPTSWDHPGSRTDTWRPLWHVLGYSQNGTWDIPDINARRHEGTGLPVTLADGHAEFLLANVVTAGATFWVVGAAPWNDTTRVPETPMDFSFRYLYRTDPSIDD